MPKPFEGTINVDIRDSVPDWEPYVQPKAPAGAPNVLTICWDGVGYGAVDVGGDPYVDHEKEILAYLVRD